MKIKDSLKRDANNYIVMPKILKFCRANKLECGLKNQCIKEIENFADQSEYNLEKVNKWLDESIKEGIKHIYIGKISFENDDLKYKSQLFWKEFSKRFNIPYNIHINNCSNYDVLEYGGISWEIENKNVVKINLIISLTVADTTKSITHPYVEGYPIFIEIDINRKIVTIRLKSKSKLYMVKDDNGIKIADMENRIGFDKLAYQIFKKLSLDIGFVSMDNMQFHEMMRSAYYRILHEIVETPEKIKSIINRCKDLNHKYIDDIIDKTGISKEVYSNQIKEDLNMLLEKFISISYPDQNIFKNAYAFPVNLIATDSEDTKVEETASDLQPLQTKAAFYDHKKIIKAEKKCDGMKLAIHRKDATYYGKYPFIVKYDFIHSKGLGRIRIEEYVEEVDIQNVLSRIISAL